PRLRSGQELGRQERGLPALERDRADPERHADRGRRQERPLDDGGRRGRPRRIILQGSGGPLFLMKRTLSRRPRAIRAGVCTVLLVLSLTPAVYAQAFEQV